MNGAEAWAPPEAFDDFRVIRPLGRGGMGQVYLGHDEVLDRPVALKLIATDSPDPHARERFRIEARSIARLSHPNVVAVFRIGEVGGRPYIAYELVRGEALDRLPRPVSWEAALRIGLGMARGLGAAHARGVLHRDIKPANVMLGPKGEVKLIDFGLAKLIDRQGEDAPSWAPPAMEAGGPDAVTVPAAITMPLGGIAAEGMTPELTDARAVLGTPLYLAPELWTGAQATTRSDVYALGLVLYELCAGLLPHASIDVRSMARWVMSRELSPLREIRPDLPAALAGAIDRCIRRAPEDRFASAEELRATLEEADAFCRAFQSVRASATSGPASSGGMDAVQASFARLAPRAEELVARFYERLFDLAPDVRPLFPADLREQRMKLASALQVVVDNLRAPDRLVPMLEDLGRRHAPYGALPEHFDAVGQALLGALAELSGERWAPRLERAWAEAYGQIAAAMRRGLQEARDSMRPSR